MNNYLYLIILYFVFFKNNLIKLVPTNPAPPVTIILFFFGILIFYLLKLINQSNDGLYQDFFPIIEFKIPLNLQK